MPTPSHMIDSTFMHARIAEVKRIHFTWKVIFFYIVFWNEFLSVNYLYRVVIFSKHVTLHWVRFYCRNACDIAKWIIDPDNNNTGNAMNGNWQIDKNSDIWAGDIHGRHIRTESSPGKDVEHCERDLSGWIKIPTVDSRMVKHPLTWWVDNTPPVCHIV